MSETRTRPDGTRQSRGRDLVLAYGLVVPVVLATAAAVGAADRVAFAANGMGTMLAASVLLYLAGAVRGASRGALLPLVMFLAGFAAILSLFLGLHDIAAVVTLAGFLIALIAGRRPLLAIRFGPAALVLLAASMLVLVLQNRGVL